MKMIQGNTIMRLAATSAKEHFQSGGKPPPTALRLAVYVAALVKGETTADTIAEEFITAAQPPQPLTKEQEDRLFEAYGKTPI